MSELRGHLDLVCSADAEGRSYLSHQSFSIPFHLSKPHWEHGILTVQVVNPTAGLFAGDQLGSRVRVQGGAKLRLTSPSASRPHTMTEGWAVAEQGFEVESGGWLDYFPAPLIPQTGSRYRQRTRIALQSGAELFFLEILAPGRVARGEVFQFAELDWNAELRIGGALVAKERFRLRPEQGSVAGFQEVFPAAYYASGYLITERIPEGDPIWDEIRALNSEDLFLGVSRLVRGGWSLRLVARDSVALRSGVEELRALLGRAIPQLRHRIRA